MNVEEIENKDIEVNVIPVEDVKNIALKTLLKGMNATTLEISAVKDTDTEYILHIKTDLIEFDTPNLKGEQGDKGEPGTTNYMDQENKPQINGITLSGNKTADELNLQPKGDYATKDYVEQEIATFDFIKIVTELPETGLVNRTYFVPKTNTETNDLYDEYMWIDDKWELVGTKQIEVDLTEYVKNTDYANNNNFGVVKTDSNYGIQTENGVLYINRASAAQIKTRHQWAPITPNNLDFALKTGMCDGVGEAWTEDEKLKAQERIGVSKIPSGMTLAADIVLEENVERVNFNEIIVKNYEKLIIYVFRPATTFSSGYGSVSFSSNVGGGLGGTVYNAFSTNEKINVRNTMVKTDGTKFEVTCEWVNAGTNINDTAFIKSLYRSDANPYSGYLVINTSQTFPVGTHILIYTK